MGHFDDENHKKAVVDTVDHTVIADTNPPKIVGTYKFLATLGSWVDTERFDSSVQAAACLHRKLLDLFANAPRELDAVVH